MDIFEKFDKAYDNEGLKKDINEAKENGGTMKKFQLENMKLKLRN